MDPTFLQVWNQLGQMIQTHLEDLSAKPLAKPAGASFPAGRAEARAESTVAENSARRESATASDKLLIKHSATVPNVNPVPTERHRDRMLSNLIEHWGQQKRIKDYAVKAGILLETEDLTDWPLRYVPATAEQMKLLMASMDDFFEGRENGQAVKPFVNSEVAATEARPARPDAHSLKTKEQAKAAASSLESEPWFNVIVPVPRKGMKKAEYLKNPDTIGSLYSARKMDDHAAKRLFGFAHHFEPKGWQGKPPDKEDVDFRKALDAFSAAYEKTHPEGEKT